MQITIKPKKSCTFHTFFCRVDSFWQVLTTSTQFQFIGILGHILVCPFLSKQIIVWPGVLSPRLLLPWNWQEFWQNSSGVNMPLKLKVRLNSPESWFLLKLADWETSLSLSPASLTSHSMESKLFGRVTSVVETALASWFALIELKML